MCLIITVTNITNIFLNNNTLLTYRGQYLSIDNTSLCSINIPNYHSQLQLLKIWHAFNDNTTRRSLFSSPTCNHTTLGYTHTSPTFTHSFFTYTIHLHTLPLVSLAHPLAFHVHPLISRVHPLISHVHPLVSLSFTHSSFTWTNSLPIRLSTAAFTFPVHYRSTYFRSRRTGSPHQLNYFFSKTAVLAAVLNTWQLLHACQ